MYLSVIIPTYKRPKKLLRALKSIQKQTHKNFETIVIDNDADLQVETLIKSFNKTAKRKVRYVAQPKLGLHHARHAGAKIAKGDILVLIEDEVTFSKNCLKAYAEAFSSHREMVVAGGPLTPIWEETPPKWLIDLIGNSKIFPPLSLMKPYNEFRISKKGFFFGGNMAIKKKILYDVGGFNPDTTGDVQWGNGDVGLNRKLWQKGIPIGYVPKALLYHHIDEKRMTLDALCHWMTNAGRCDMYAIFYEKGIPKNWLGLIPYIGFFIVINLKYWIGYMFFKGRKASFWIKIKILSVRTKAQLEYIARIMNDRDLQRLVSKRKWL